MTPGFWLIIAIFALGASWFVVAATDRLIRWAADRDRARAAGRGRGEGR